jgi:ABC-type bacteriocin/lantibiotic exporter with double-glycine peptidase domain
MIGAALLAAGVMTTGRPLAPVHLAVPIVRQAPERCGPAALAMVIRYYRGDSASIEVADRAYDPVLRGALVTELARTAREDGFDAEVARPDPDSLVTLLRSGIPPILLFESGRAPLVRQHYAVVVGWDPVRGHWEVHDGGARARRYERHDLIERWRAAGGLALVVRDRAP